MFKPKYLKEGELLLKGVRRFINYRRDLLPAEKVDEIEGLAEQMREALSARDKRKIEKLGKTLTKTCEGVGRDYRSSALAENIEVVFVAIAIALGIRAYIAQPFKIPTGSMQPTLNGIVAHPSDTAQKNPVVRLLDKVRLGRSYVNVVARQDETIRRFVEQTRFKFFTSTLVYCDSGNAYRIPAPVSQVDGAGGGPFDLSIGQRFARGEVIARGWVDTGDQVIVDKMSYHFIPPRRGEVFVFTTEGISGIRLPDPRMGSIHYIKRLAGLPGDDLLVREPKLFVNGEEAKEFGFRRVMTEFDKGYRGYQELSRRKFDVPPDKYVALGDNSFNSYDSRGWGYVPEPNLVGRAILVYWPFNRHWGVIR
jgi:signal peptidase I